MIHVTIKTLVKNGLDLQYMIVEFSEKPYQSAQFENMNRIPRLLDFLLEVE